MSPTPNPTRVLHVVHSLQCGGAEVLVRDLIAQRGDDYHFEVLSLSGDGPLAREIEALGGVVHRYQRKAGFDRGCAKAIARIVRDHNIDIIHAHQYSPWVYAAAARLCGARRAKVIYTEHGRPYPDMRKRKRVLANRLALLRLTHRITVVSSFIGKALQRCESIPANRIELIYNGIDPTPMLRPTVDPSLTRQALGIGKDQIMVLQVAGFRPVKDHATAIRAMSRLRGRYTKVRLVLAGSGETMTATRDLVKHWGLEDRVTFLGLRDDVRNLWHAADIGLLSSLSEGTSVALMEAMAAGKPVVATDVGGNPELVLRHKTGLLTPRREARDMALAIATLVDDAALRQTMGEAGRKRICEQFTQSRMHDQFTAMYEQLVPKATCHDRGNRSLIVFADDFGRHPSSMQHLAIHLSRDRQIVWINTIGMRRPKLCVADMTRAASKITRWLKPDRAAGHAPLTAPANIRVINPIMWPSFAGPVQRWINKKLLGRAVRRATRSLPGPVQAITTLPITADLRDAGGVTDWTYYMVDDYANWPGHDGQVLAAMDRKQLGWVRRVMTVSEVLADYAEAQGAKPTMLTHGIDLDHWRAMPRSAIAERIGRIRGATAVFWGLIDARLDIEAIRHLAEHASVALVGPTQGDVDELLSIPNVQHTGQAAHGELPAIAAEADVLIMPYADLPVTRAMQPLKLKEYLATDKPVVCLPLPALYEWADGCDVVRPNDFTRRVLQRVESGLPESQRESRRRLLHETWQAKAARFAGVLRDEPARDASLAA